LGWTGGGGATGGDALTLEILIETIPFMEFAMRVCAWADNEW
jgi:hypothetical protein